MDLVLAHSKKLNYLVRTTTGYADGFSIILSNWMHILTFVRIYPGK
jgi:hypothetical protein